MRHCLIICALSISACDKPAPVLAPPYVPADLLIPCRTALQPAITERELARNMAARSADLDCTTAKLEAVAEIIGAQ